MLPLFFLHSLSRGTLCNACMVSESLLGPASDSASSTVVTVVEIKGMDGPGEENMMVTDQPDAELDPTGSRLSL